MKSGLRLKVVWGYAIEFVALLVIYAALYSIFGNRKLIAFVADAEGKLRPVILGFLAGSFSMIAIHVRLLSTEFGKWLSWRKVDQTFRQAFFVQTGIHLFCLLSMLVAGYTLNSSVLLFALWMLILSFLNFISLLENVWWLLKLHEEFQRQQK